MKNSKKNCQNPSLFSQSLALLFPKIGTFLEAETDFQFLVAVLLSAQMTDKGVNKTTKKFFAVMKTPQDAFEMGEEKIYSFVKSVNYAPTKAKHIFSSSKILMEKFHGEIPKTRKELITLPGVGAKTAGVFLLHKGYEYAFPVDTHIKRVAKSFGFTVHENPDKVEKDLQKLFPKEEWLDLHLRIILYGRNFLTARNIPHSTDEAWEILIDLVQKK